MDIKHLAGVSLVLVLTGSANAERMGVNFVDGSPETQTLAPTALAGVAAVAQTNWNNMTIASGDGNGHNNGGTLGTVTNDSGAAVALVSVRVSATPTTQVWPFTGASWGFAGSNLTMQLGGLYPQPKITVSGIPYKAYYVYVYATCGLDGGSGSVTISVANGVHGTVDPVGTYFYRYTWLNGNFTLSTATTLADAQASSGSNYIVFKNNTASDFTLDWDGKLVGGWSGPSAIQIVEVPPLPPAGMVLSVK